MAERNPYIPSERRQEMEGRTQIREDEANRRFAEQQAELKRQAEANAAQEGEAAEKPDSPEDETTLDEEAESRPRSA